MVPLFVYLALRFFFLLWIYLNANKNVPEFSGLQGRKFPGKEKVEILKHFLVSRQKNGTFITFGEGEGVDKVLLKASLANFL